LAESKSSPSGSHRPRAAIARLIINALSMGLSCTTLLAIIVLWLEKRSGVELDSEQYRGLMLIIFLVITLSAYVVLEFFQHREDLRLAREEKTKAARRPRQRDLPPPAYAPIFAEPAIEDLPTSSATPEGEPQPSAAFAGIANESPASAATPAAAMTATAAAAVQDASAAVFTDAVNAAVASFEEAPTPFGYFGIYLYVTGACGELVRRSGIDVSRGKSVLIEMLSNTGLSKRNAASFAANANTFAQIPNFRGTIDAGYRAMAHLQEAGFVNIGDLVDMLAQWQLQQHICMVPEPVTFLATSVAVTPPGAATTPEDRQRVIRAHNTMITPILERFEGRELHHLGNGVIAAFKDAGLAVRAAESLQEQLDAFAHENAALMVAPRVGIDTDMAAVVNGIPVSGAMTRAVSIASVTPVQNIYCSESTKDDSAEIVEFEAVAVSEAYNELPPLFAARWSRMPAKGGPAVEYRHIGALAEAS
jgi:class 3 adenylate cyclase